MEHIKLVYLNDQRREIRAANCALEIVGLGRAARRAVPGGIVRANRSARQS
jgi:hypothetical protein